VGGEGYCRHESLRDYDERTAALVAGIESFGRAVHPDDLDAGDVVHFDLHPGNILHQRGRLSAVVDTDFAQVGDAAFDLVTLALASLALSCDRGVRSRLFAAAFDGLSDVRRRAYLGHLFIRFLDWPIRRGRHDEVGFWLGHAESMLDL
jgi:aminoglycoside phosphotransferase (APT) family kinase protein